MKSIKFALSLTLLALALSAAQAATVWVDVVNGSDATGDGTAGNPVATINNAFINFAVDGDTIQVMPGTYPECVEISEFAAGVPRAVELVADDWVNNSDNTTTIIDAGGQCLDPFGGVNLWGDGNSFEGFTVTGAAASGVYVRGTATVTNNVIDGNASTFGGGIYVYSANCYYGATTTSIADNTVTNNSTDYDQGLGTGGDGGGVYVYTFPQDDPSCLSGDATVDVTGNTISDNTIQGDTLSATNQPFGGGLVVFTNTTLLRNTTVTVTQNTISDNMALAGSSSYGGGAWVQTFGYGYETIDVNNNIFGGNTSTGDGGGLSAWILTFDSAKHTLNVDDNTMTGNTALGNGGGVDLFMFAEDLLPMQTLSLRASGNTVTGNSAAGSLGGGGGILASFFSNRSDGAFTTMNFSVTGNRVTNNSATFMGGGMGVLVSADADPETTGVNTNRTTSQIDVNNNLVADNTAQGTGLAPGGGIFTYLQSFGDGFATMTATQNTIADNLTDANASGVHVEQLADFDGQFNFEGTNRVRLNSNIVAGNDGLAIGGPGASQPGVITDGSGLFNILLNADYNSFFNNTGGTQSGATWINLGNGNLEGVDPLLTGALYQPDRCSPTLDAADPILAFVDEPGANGGRANMGHTGSTTDATSSFADLNGDGAVDGIDIVWFSSAYLTAPTDLRFLAPADLDGDDLVGPDDLAFLAPQFGEICP